MPASRSLAQLRRGERSGGGAGTESYLSTELRAKGKLKYLRPDAKSQVTLRFEEGKPAKATAIVVSTQHKPGYDQGTRRAELHAYVQSVVARVMPAMPGAGGAAMVQVVPNADPSNKAVGTTVDRLRAALPAWSNVPTNWNFPWCRKARRSATVRAATTSPAQEMLATAPRPRTFRAHRNTRCGARPAGSRAAG